MKNLDLPYSKAAQTGLKHYCEGELLFVLLLTMEATYI